MEEREAAVGSHLRVEFFFSSGSRQMLFSANDGQHDGNKKNKNKCHKHVFAESGTGESR